MEERVRLGRDGEILIDVDCGGYTTEAVVTPSDLGRVLGFTWEDVDNLRTLVAEMEHDLTEEVRSIANRIAFLLPPREEA